MPTILITGCDYGIGFEFARQYVDDGWRVHAVCLETSSRRRIEALEGDSHFHCLDVTDHHSVVALGESLEDEALDVLINNAATFAPDGHGPLALPDPADFNRVMQVNAVAPVYVAETFAAHLAASDRKLLACISTRSGSIGDNGSGGHYAYRCSKAALNMAVKSFSIDLAERGIVSVALHPGSVATETRKGGQIDVEESVRGMRGILAGVTPAHTGSFLRYDGGTIEW